MRPYEKLDETASGRGLRRRSWMRRGRRLVLMLALFAAATPTAHAGLTLGVNCDTLFDDVINQPTPQPTRVLDPPAGPSTCGTPSSTPSAVANAAPHSYDAYTILNTTAAAECVIATVRSESAGMNAFA